MGIFNIQNVKLNKELLIKESLTSKNETITTMYY